MNNNQFNGGQYPQQPMGVQQPMYGQPVQKKSNIVAIIVIAVVVVLVIGGVILSSGGSGGEIKGEWECTYGKSTVSIKATEDTINVSGGGFLQNSKYKKHSQFKTSKKKKGYSYKSYQIIEDKKSSQTKGFIFGTNKDGEGHFINGSASNAAEFICKKK